MADVTDEDLAKKRDSIEKLREQVAEAHSTREERERALGRELEMKQLAAEEARLRLELSNAREAAKVASVKAGASGLLDAATEQEKAVAAQAKAAEKAATADDDDDDTKAAAKSAAKE